MAAKKQKRRNHVPSWKTIENRVEIEGRKQCYLAYGSAAIALYRHGGLEKDTIMQLFEITHEAWLECAADTSKSMVAMCEEETGVEIQNGNGKSWKDLPFLNGQSSKMIFTPATLAYMRKQQIQWVAAQVIAAILVALSRKYDYDADMCARFYAQVQNVQVEFGFDPMKTRDAALEETGVLVDEYSK